MPKLNPEAQKKRNATYSATMAARRAAKENGMHQVTPAEVLAAKPQEIVKNAVERINKMSKVDPRIELAREIVRLLERVLA